MAKLNCWEFKDCGRQPGGKRCLEGGTCLAATEVRADGIHQGKNAGRACWAVAGTLCAGRIQGSFAMKYHNCRQCDFYKTVSTEEGPEFMLAKNILDRLK